MSYDLMIWSTNKPSFEDAFFNGHSAVIDGIRVFRNEGWQIAINMPCGIVEEDIPYDITGALPGIAYLTEINLEPISAPTEARRLLDKISKIIARSSHGLIVDEQDGTVTTPVGVKRLKPMKAENRKKVMSMGWWFLDDRELKKDGLRRLIESIKLEIPEAMPRRYGLFEPPQYKLAEQGEEHFTKFLYDNLHEGIVWYPGKPFDFIGVSVPSPIGPSKAGFRAGHITIEFYEEVLRQPGWPQALKRFWLHASDIILPFFSMITHGGCGSWWWNGIPRRDENLPYVAAMIGDPYAGLWPEFLAAAGKTVNGLYYVSRIGETFESISPLSIFVPSNIAQVMLKKTTTDRKTMKMSTVMKPAAAPYDKIYPEIWPFDGPFIEE